MMNEIGDNMERAGKQSSAFVFAVGLCVLLACIFSVTILVKGKSNCKIEVCSRINPNEASAVSLSRLPGIGIGRANAITEYRLEHTNNGGVEAAFTDCNDLNKVKGIGPTTVNKIRQWVEFK